MRKIAAAVTFTVGNGRCTKRARISSVVVFPHCLVTLRSANRGEIRKRSNRCVCTIHNAIASAACGGMMTWRRITDEISSSNFAPSTAVGHGSIVGEVELAALLVRRRHRARARPASPRPACRGSRRARRTFQPPPCGRARNSNMRQLRQPFELGVIIARVAFAALLLLRLAQAIDAGLASLAFHHRLPSRRSASRLAMSLQMRSTSARPSGGSLRCLVEQARDRERHDRIDVAADQIAVEAGDGAAAVTAVVLHIDEGAPALRTVRDRLATAARLLVTISISQSGASANASALSTLHA